jgi:hypothetical protein
LEFRCGRKVAWDFISRDARPAAAVEARAAGKPRAILSVT